MSSTINNESRYVAKETTTREIGGKIPFDRIEDILNQTEGKCHDHWQSTSG